MRLPRDGVYRIEATRYGSTTGRYALRVDRGFEAAVGDLDRDCDVDSVDRDRLRSLLGGADPNADLDLDGQVSTRDAIFQMRNFARLDWADQPRNRHPGSVPPTRRRVKPGADRLSLRLSIRRYRPQRCHGFPAEPPARLPIEPGSRGCGGEGSTQLRRQCAAFSCHYSVA